MVTRRKVLQMVSGASAAVLAGCGFVGGDDDGGDGGGDGGDGNPGGVPGNQTAGLRKTTQPLKEIGTSTAAQEYPRWDWSQLEEAEVQDTATVKWTDSFEFEPMIARVPPGTEVTFDNPTNNQHALVIPKLDVDKLLVMGDSTTVTFEDPGTYNLLCRQHEPEEVGRVVVDETVTLDESGETDTPDEES